MELQEYIKTKLKSVGMDDVIVGSYETKAHQIKFANSKIVKTGVEINEGINIFVSKNKKIAVTSLKDLSKKAADGSIRELVNFVKSIKPSVFYNGVAEGPFYYNNIKEIDDVNVDNLGEEKIVDIVNEAINIAHENGAKRTAGILEIYSAKGELLSSNKISASNKNTGLYFSIRSFADKDASGHKVCCSRMLDKLDYKWAAQESAHIAKMALKPKAVNISGNMDVLFDPLPFSNILDHYGNAASIFNVESGLSFFMNRLNKRVAPSFVNIIDDGTLPNGFASGPFDAEGVPLQRNYIIKRGILNTYLHNTSTAKRYKTSTTANAGLVAPEPWNLILEPGDYKFEELVKEVKNGVYITNLWYTRFQNYVSGDFSTIPRDGIFYIKNGKIQYPIREIRINDNMLSLLNNIKAIGNDPRQVHGWEVSIPTVTPHVLVKDINITKPQK